jgi:hypothetical protein
MDRWKDCPEPEDDSNNATRLAEKRCNNEVDFMGHPGL